MIADISHYQGAINWASARKQLDLCIFRTSVGNSRDKKYVYNALNCGLPFGVYHYVKAGTIEGAETEARFFYETATQDGLKPLFFVMDIEYDTQTQETTKPVMLKFAEVLRSLGVQKIGLYITQNRYSYVQDSLDKVDFIWIPRYGKDTGFKDNNYAPKYPCDLWQYTSKARILGIQGNVDLNALNGDKSMEWFTEQSSAVVPEDKTMLEVTGGRVRIRQGDGTSFNKVETITKGTKLEPVLDKNGEPIISKNGWYAIYYKNEILWISGKYIR